MIFCMYSSCIGELLSSGANLCSKLILQSDNSNIKLKLLPKTTKLKHRERGGKLKIIKEII